MAEPGGGSGCRWRLALAIVSSGALAWCSWTCWAGRAYRLAVEEVQAEMASGRFALAAGKLNALLAQYPRSDETMYLLGVCEQKRGHSQAAAEILARVTPGSAVVHQAILARMRLFHDSGQLAAAEQVILDAAADPRNEPTDVRVLLVPIYSQLGRLEESLRLIEDQWEHLNATSQGASERSIDLVRMHIELDFKPNPIADVRAYLDQAQQMAADDDRVWLGRANLAIRTGDHAEAKHWLNACLQRRPADVAVWRSRLRWGIATSRVNVVQQAVVHLPAEVLTVGETHRVGAWLAARRGDAVMEREELEHLLAFDPADVPALERLGQLLEQAGQPAQAAELTREKAKMGNLRARYEKLYDRKQPIRDAAEMARIAEQLGRRFEARVFLTLTIAADPDRADLRRDLERLSRNSPEISEPAR